MRTATLALLIAACGPTTSVEEDARSISIDTDWTYSGTVHSGEAREAPISPAPQRRVYAFFAGATAQAPIDVDFTVAGDMPVRVALLAPIDGGGNRAVVGSAGYSEATDVAIVHAHLTQAGAYRIVIASFNRAYEGTFALVTRCAGGACENLDALVTPRAGALAADRMIEVRINPALINGQIELWGRGQRMGQAWTSQGLARIPVPAAERVADGDDLLLVVPGIDDGVPVRLWTRQGPGVRFDSLALNNAGNVLSGSGVAGFFEGQSIVALRNEVSLSILATQNLRTDLPGQEGTGLAEFDANLVIPLAALPRSGQLMSLGSIETASGNSLYVRWGCFEWGTLTPASCPAAAWASPVHAQ
jgi:hypothetical protein